MKILAVSDIESPRFYDYYRPGMLKKYDCILINHSILIVYRCQLIYPILE